MLHRALEADAGFAAVPDVVNRSLHAEGWFAGFAVEGSGAHLVLDDGREVLDLVLAYGAVVLGHADDVVDRAVIAELRRGVARTLRSPVQLELAEALVALIPNAEQALLLRTGSDATSAAVRVARAATGRDRIVHRGYHGWHDWCARRPAGVPSAVRALTSTVSADGAEALERALMQGPPPAAVVMLPFETGTPDRDALAACRDLAHGAGALFVLDELRTGFRVAPGGAQELLGVAADLTVLGKALGNGYAISALTGPRDLMRHVGNVSMNSLFFRTADGAAAAVATLGELARRDVVARLRTLGTSLQEGMARAAADAGLRGVRQIGVPSMPFHEFGLPAEVEAHTHLTFCRAAAEAGVMFHPGHHWFVCASMTETDVDRAVKAARRGYDAVAQRMAEVDITAAS